MSRAQGIGLRSCAARLAALAVLCTAPLALTSAAAVAAGNLLSNGTFEGTGSGSLTGWGGSGGTLSLVAGHGGGHAARLTASAASKDYAYTSKKPVTNAAAGAAYTLTGFASSASSGQTVCLILKEIPAGGTSTVGSAQSCLAATGTWTAFPTVSYTVAHSGDQLTVNVQDSSPAKGSSFDIDDLSLTAGGQTGDQTAPSVPMGVTASANSSTSATVSWTASTDNVGVTGYDIMRDGNRVMTVGGSVTSWTDNGLSPQTTYGYTVDAFDAAGNTSGASSPAASVTTPAGGGGGGGATLNNPCGAVSQSSAPYAHIVVLMDENLTYPAWQSAPGATYTHLLGNDCRLETNAAGETHPSFPNYLAVSGGSFTTCLGCNSSADNIFHQLDVAGGSWRDYNQSMPGNCHSNTSSVPQYRSGHNPAFWYTDLGAKGDNTCAKYDVPADPNMWNDIANDNLPQFAWVAPDDCYDVHWQNGPCEKETGTTKADRIKLGDQYIKQLMQAIVATPSYQAGKTLLIVTWDESNEGSVLNKGNWGMDCSNPSVYNANKATCQVVTILVSARIP
ncbi:MAG TPA: alkaline phosphatase family protein, partial [Gaiellales bacterium]|nr:alkaline phosphatase family protein [Gaiellales bacterium]